MARMEHNNGRIHRLSGCHVFDRRTLQRERFKLFYFHGLRSSRQQRIQSAFRPSCGALRGFVLSGNFIHLAFVC